MAKRKTIDAATSKVDETAVLPLKSSLTELRKKAIIFFGVCLLLATGFLVETASKDGCARLWRIITHWRQAEPQLLDSRMSGVWRDCDPAVQRPNVTRTLFLDARNGTGGLLHNDEGFELVIGPRLTPDSWSVDVCCVQTGSTVSERGSLSRLPNNLLQIDVDRKDGTRLSLTFSRPSR